MTIKKFLKDYPSDLFEDSFKIIFNKENKVSEEIKVGEGKAEFTLVLNGPLDKKAIAKDPSLASLVLGEAYMDKIIDVKGDFFKAFTTVMGIREGFLPDHKFLRGKRDVSKAKQKEEVSSHYDIGNDFYKLWLDETMNYSCAYFKDPEDTLYEAQTNKVNYIIDKLQIDEGMSLLDIGCGWGNLLIAAAKKHNIKGTGITLSEEQYKEFKDKIQKENLEENLHVKLMDYRELKDSNLSFDRVVSVGMIEHVGNENYDLFLDNAKAVLKEKGIFLLHFISGHKEGAVDPWINKYIFPGGVLPSLREVIHKGVEKDFHIIDVESLRKHYVQTLLSWYANFIRKEDTIRNMFDERFVGMWKLYLIACAANFHIGGIYIYQVVFTNGVNNNLPMTRENLYK